MVSHSIKEHHGNIVCPGLVPDFTKSLKNFLLIEVIVICSWNSVGQYTAAVRRNPIEQIPGKRFFMFAGTHEYIIIHSAEFQYLGEHSVVTKGVDIIADPDCYTELLPEIPL